MIVHQSTVGNGDVASGTHKVGRILVATGKRQPVLALQPIL